MHRRQPTEDDIIDLSDLLLHIVSSIVPTPDEIDIVGSRTSNAIGLTLTVMDDDAKFVTGKGGANIKAIQHVMGLAASAKQLRMNLTLTNRKPTCRPIHRRPKPFAGW